MYLGLPQIIYLALAVFGLGLSISQHGKPKTGKENFWSTLISTGLIMSLLYWGGFFS